MADVEIWLAAESFDDENFREAAFHARNGRTVLLHHHCHTQTCTNPPRPHRHAPCGAARHWHAVPGGAILELPAGSRLP